MDQRLGVVTWMGATAVAARRGLAGRDRGELLGRDHGSLGLGMLQLSAPSATAGRDRRLPLEPRRVGRWRLRRVGRVLVEPGFKVGDPLLKPADHGGEAGLGLGSEGVPDGLRDRFQPGHDTVIARSGARHNSPGRELLSLVPMNNRCVKRFPITPGQAVLDLGTGAEIDRIVGAGRVGPSGRVIGAKFYGRTGFRTSSATQGGLNTARESTETPPAAGS